MRFNPLKLLFFLSVLFLAFMYGVATWHFKMFPYRHLNRALISYQALDELKKTTAAEDKSWPADFWETGKSTQPTATAHGGTPGDELILIAGGMDQMKEHCPQYGCVAWLMDRRGQVRHVWHYDPATWMDLDYIKGEVRNRLIYPVGLHLFDNGDLLVSYQAKNTYPIGVGIAKYDKDSKLLWKRADFNHHWFSVSDTGEIYVPAMRVVDSPLALGNTRFSLQCKQSRIALDAITVLSADGTLLREIPLLDAYLDSGYVGIFHGNPCDPTHLNDLQLVGDTIPAYPPGVKKGDIFLSARTLNALSLLDGETARIKWMSVGAAIEQHSVRFDGNGGVFAFDNKGGAQGGSRVVKVDMVTGQSETVFPKPGASLSEDIYSQFAGHLDLHRDRTRMLVASTHQGLVWEIDIPSGEVLWEFINTHPLRGKYGRFPVHTAKYVYNATFTLNNRERVP